MAFVEDGIFFGKQRESARKSRSLTLTCVSQPPTTGEGYIAFTTVPNGAFILTCL